MKSRRQFWTIRRTLSAAAVIAIVTSITLFGTTPLTASAYVDTLGNVLSASYSGDNVTIVVDNGSEANDDILELKVCEDDILKVNYRPNGITSSAETPMIDTSHTWSSVGATINVSSDPITISTSSMLIQIARTPCRMTVKKADGTTLFWEPSSTGVYHDGVRFVRSSSQNMYGLSSYACFDSNGQLLRNNTTAEVKCGTQGNSGGPFMWSTAGYGLLVDADGGYPVLDDSTNKMEFYYGNVAERRYTKNDVEYYIMLGDPENIMTDYSHITGQSPMLPKWSLGFSNYEWGVNQSELYSMVDTYRAKDIPIDSYGIDYDWKNYGADNYGEFTWNTTNFPDASSTTLKTTLLNLGIHLIGITKPRIVTYIGGTQTVQGAYASANGYFYPGQSDYTDYFFPVTVRSIDPYNSGCRSWFWQHSEDAFDKGIAGWWNDETDSVSSNGTSYTFGNFNTLHLSQALYEGQRSYTNNSVRVWQTARTYYPGTQRYASTIWSGDTGTQFSMNEDIWWTNGLNEQKATMLSTIDNGQMKWGSDGGGFNQNTSTIENPDPELYTRWLQYAAFSPVFRVHGNFNHQRQPWYYGLTAEEDSKAIIQLRYALMPYIYSYEYKALTTGVGLVKPLLFDYPSDSNVANYTDAYMFGDWMLVSPVTARDQTSKSIYLPAGTWIDYFTGNVYTGGQTINYAVNNDSWTDVPVFIKKGAIIPTQKVLDYTSQQDITSVDVDVFADTAATSFNYYDDDGSSYDYENGEYFKQVITAQDQGTNGVQVAIGDNTGTYSSPLQYYYLKVHGKAGSSCTINGSSATSYSSLDALKAASGEGYARGKDIYGDVTYVKVAAAATKTVIVNGSVTQTATSTKYEAEDASLSGNTVAGQAGTNTNHTGYTGTGFADKFETDGAAATFDVNVKAGGNFPVSIRYANGSGSARTMSLYVNGTFIRQGSFAATTNWDTWATSSQELPLVAGANRITIKYDSSNDTGYFNIDNISVPFFPETEVYEAESAALSGGPTADSNHWYYTGVGFVDKIEAVGSNVTFNVNVPTAGTYSTALSFCNANGSVKTLNAYVNGTFQRTDSLPSSGTNWNVWSTYTQSFTLSAGWNTISFRYDSSNSGYVNLDNLKLTLSTPTASVETNLLDNGGFERSTSQSSNWTEWHPSGQSLAYGVDTGKGTNPPQAAAEGGQRAYFYLSSAYQQSIHQTQSITNGTYKVDFWVRQFGTTPTIARAEIASYGGSTIYYDVASSSTWKHVTIDTITVTSSTIDIGFYVNSPGGTTMQIDGVRLIKK